MPGSKQGSKRYTQTALTKAILLSATFGETVIKRARRANRVDIDINQATSKTCAEAVEQAFANLIGTSEKIPVHGFANQRVAYFSIHTPIADGALLAAAEFARAGLPVTLGYLEPGTTKSNIVPVAAPTGEDPNLQIIVRPKEWPQDWRDRLPAVIEALNIATGHAKRANLSRAAAKAAEISKVLGVPIDSDADSYAAFCLITPHQTAPSGGLTRAAIRLSEAGIPLEIRSGDKQEMIVIDADALPADFAAKLQALKPATATISGIGMIKIDLGRDIDPRPKLIKKAQVTAAAVPPTPAPAVTVEALRQQWGIGQSPNSQTSASTDKQTHASPPELPDALQRRL